MKKSKLRHFRIKTEPVSETKKSRWEDCKCRFNRWKTKVKGKVYECRNCGTQRELG